jgi:metal-responsive CopG/Arc/MetJ family transcriptional regulator
MNEQTDAKERRDREPVSVLLERELLEVLDRTARVERRTRSDQLRWILSKALEPRREGEAA